MSFYDFTDWIYKTFTGFGNYGNPDYAIAGVGRLYVPHERDSGLEYVSFMSSHNQRKKGTSNKHDGNHEVSVTVNGREIIVNKKQKPEGMTLHQWIAQQFRLNEKETRRVCKMFH